jgi:hypothetical protein
MEFESQIIGFTNYTSNGAKMFRNNDCGAERDAEARA